MPKNPESPHPLLQQITARAVTDPDFRRKLLADPDRAVREAFGTPLPAGQRIRFIEKPADVDVLVVLPDPQSAGDALDDDDLDAVAGGGDEDCPLTNYTW